MEAALRGDLSSQLLPAALLNFPKGKKKNNCQTFTFFHVTIRKFSEHSTPFKTRSGCDVSHAREPLGAAEGKSPLPTMS